MLRKNQRVIVDLKKSVKNSTRNCCTLFTQRPIMSPRNRATMTETRQCRCCDSLTLLQSLFAFYQFLHYCPFSVPGSNLQSHMVFPCHVSSVSNLWQSLSRGLAGPFCMCPSIWDSVMYFNDEIEVLQFWPECYRSDIVPLPVRHIEGSWC